LFILLPFNQIDEIESVVKNRDDAGVIPGGSKNRSFTTGRTDLNLRGPFQSFHNGKNKGCGKKAAAGQYYPDSP
jgi:hypothetical protein